MNAKPIDNIIWDWNGTLLNDVEMCIECMNHLLKPRNLPKLNLEKYREVFTFPVKDYYEKVGIDFEKDPFDTIGHHFMDLYFERLDKCELQHRALDILESNKRRGLKQFILSAMEQKVLEKSLHDLGVFSYFEAVYGIDNHLAAGKLERAFQMIEDFDICKAKTLLIGDTLHDAEVGSVLNIEIVLVANGHQNYDRLKRSGEIVIKDFTLLESTIQHKIIK
jgi:phosphoglycolate phosphatase